MSEAVAVNTGEQQRRVNAENALGPLSLIIWAVGFFFSLFGFLWMFWSAGAVGWSGFPILGVLLHFVSVAAAWFGTLLAKGRDHPAARGWAILVAFFALFGGPLGYLAGVACFLFGVGQPTEMPLVDVVKAEMWIRPMILEREGDFVPFEIQLREELRTQPIVDLLPYADVPTAIAIINKLAETRKRDDIELLREMVQDRRQEVYQYALSKLDELEKEYATKIYHLKEQLRHRPQEATLRVELAKLYLDYTQSGLLDAALEDYYWELTMAQLFEAMKLETRDTQLVVDLARLFIARRMFREAQLVVEEAIRKEPNNLAAQLLLLECQVEQAQAQDKPTLLYQARRHALESAWAVKVPAKKDMHPQFDLAQFWFGRAREKKRG